MRETDEYWRLLGYVIFLLGAVVSIAVLSALFDWLLT